MTAMPAASASRGVAKRAGLPVDHELALVAAVRVDAAEHLDQRGLAGAVLAAQRVDLAGAQVEADVLERDDAAEALDDRRGPRGGRHALMPAQAFSGGPAALGHSAIDLVVVWNPSLITVSTMLSLVDRDHVGEHDGTSILPLFTVCGATTTLRACASVTASSAALRGQRLERLVDRHRLRAADDALAGDELGVLAGDQHLAGEAFFGQRLDGAAGGAVVAGEHRVEGVGRAR